MSNIPIPPQTHARMADLLNVLQSVQGQLTAIEMTLRETLNVPNAYRLTNINEGFVPPDTPGLEAAGQDE